MELHGPPDIANIKGTASGAWMIPRRRTSTRTTHAASLGQVLGSVLHQVEKQHGVLRTVQQRWPRLAGRALKAHTRPVGFHRGRLTVHVDRPGDAFALSFQRQRLLKQLQGMTAGRVEELVIRAGEV